MPCLIIAKKTLSLIWYYQVIGRLMRVSPEKEFGIVSDLFNNYSLFGRIEDLILTKEKDDPKSNLWCFSSNGRQLTNKPVHEIRSLT